MGKLPYLYTESEETEDTSSSVENIKKKKKLSILKYTGGNLRKKKCKVHSKSDPDDSELRSRSRSSQRIGQKLRGILKHTEHESTASDDDEESESSRILHSKDRCFVGRVPRPAGSKPGRGGGVAIVVRKNVSSLQPQQSTSSTKRKKTKRLLRKQSY
ncbi:uncharacterized protein LOC123701790 [Colias croceus]|uniref:uncharacterized protein LOC123701790 n=1 Tax=Colias crocea TaxID=72248 RepID=UPI001E27E74A|nr:uncharacterized protein LOC123701790 [Colias croceus]CAG4939321.1 unnamed protein product [Colias eurytheme]